MFAPDQIEFPLSRRQVLRSAGAGFGHLALGWHAGAGRREPPARARRTPSRRNRPTSSRRRRRIIFLFMQGAISQMDTFEYKPQLQQRRREARPGRRNPDRLEVRLSPARRVGNVVLRAHAAHGRPCRQALLASGPLHRHAGPSPGRGAVAHRQRECRAHPAEHGGVASLRAGNREPGLAGVRHHQPAAQLRRCRELRQRIPSRSLPGHTHQRSGIRAEFEAADRRPSNSAGSSS